MTFAFPTTVIRVLALSGVLALGAVFLASSAQADEPLGPCDGATPLNAVQLRIESDGFGGFIIVSHQMVERDGEGGVIVSGTRRTHDEEGAPEDGPVIFSAGSHIERLGDGTFVIISRTATVEHGEEGITTLASSCRGV